MVPARPGRSGRLAWVRSRAWTWVFSSKQNTAARSGGSMYRPTMSTSLASKSGSVDSLKRSTRQGRIFRARHSWATKSLPTPWRAAIARVDHCVEPSTGTDSRVSFTMSSTTEGSTRRFRPRPGAIVPTASTPHCSYLCVAADFARQDPRSFRPHLTGSLAFLEEAICVIDSQGEAVLVGRAEVRPVRADAVGPAVPGGRRSRGRRGPVDHLDPAQDRPRRRRRGAVREAGPPQADDGGAHRAGRAACRGAPSTGDDHRAGHRAGRTEGKSQLGMSGPIPSRVSGAAKARLLELIDDAVDAGWTVGRICGVLELDRRRAWRWQARRATGTLEDGEPGGNPIHGLLDWEITEILAIFEEWGDVDLSHRKLAHRGSYQGRVWVSSSTVDRVLARHGLVLAGEPRPPRSKKRPWPD